METEKIKKEQKKLEKRYKRLSRTKAVIDTIGNVDLLIGVSTLDRFSLRALLICFVGFGTSVVGYLLQNMTLALNAFFITLGILTAPILLRLLMSVPSDILLEKLKETQEDIRENEEKLEAAELNMTVYQLREHKIKQQEEKAKQQQEEEHKKAQRVADVAKQKSLINAMILREQAKQRLKELEDQNRTKEAEQLKKQLEKYDEIIHNF